MDVQDRQAAEAAVDGHLTAVVERDLAAYRDTLHPDVTVITTSGRMLRGADEVTEFHREWFSDGDWTYRAEHVAFAHTDTTATRIVEVTYVGEPGAAPSRFLMGLTFTRTGSRWLLIHDQCTVLRTE